MGLLSKDGLLTLSYSCVLLGLISVSGSEAVELIDTTAQVVSLNGTCWSLKQSIPAIPNLPKIVVSLVGPNGKSMDVGGYCDNGDSVILYGCHGECNELWKFRSDGTIQSNGKCLTAYSINYPGGNITIDDCQKEDPSASKWIINFQIGEICNAEARFCLNLDEEDKLTSQLKNNILDQKWRLRQSSPELPKLPKIAIKVLGLNDRCMSVQNGDYRNGNPVILYGCHGGSNQLWNFTSDGTIQSNGKCLTASSINHPGGNITIDDCQKGDRSASKWITNFQIGEICTAESRFCLNLNEEGKLTSQLKNNKLDQRWRLRQSSPEIPKLPIISVKVVGLNGKCMDVQSDDYRNGNPVILYGCHGRSNQLWNFTSDGTIQSNGKCLTASSINHPGGNITIDDCQKGDRSASKWIINFKTGEIHNAESRFYLTSNKEDQLTLQSREFTLGQGWNITSDPSPTVSVIGSYDNRCIRRYDANLGVQAGDHCIAEKWAIYGDGSIRPNGERDLCMTSENLIKARAVLLLPCKPEMRGQRWKITPFGNIIKFGTGRGLVIKEGEIDSVVMSLPISFEPLARWKFLQ